MDVVDTRRSQPVPILRGFGYGRTADGRPTVIEGTFRGERTFVGGMCPCERDRARGIPTMCFACTGPADHLATSGDM